MAKRKDKADAAAATPSAPELTAAQIGQLLLEGPKSKTESSAPIIDLEPLAATSDSGEAKSGDAKPAEDAAPASRRSLPSYLPLAAAIAFAIAIGAIAGAAGTNALLRDSTSSAASTAAADATRALQDSVAQLTSEVAALKTGLANAQRTTGTQVGKLTERLDRAEKAQTEPAARIAKLQETVDKLDRRQQQAAASAADITNSVTPPPKEESKPPVVEGWRLRDFYDGRAIVESRNGTLFKIGPGSNVPGLGRVEAIKRENGKVVVVTAAGTIAGSVEQRRPSYYNPFRW